MTPSADDELQQIASALDATPQLVPFLPELLADLWEMGGSPALVAQWLGGLDLPSSSTRVLDLGCGKGAVSLRLARDLGFQVHGVDLMKPFIDWARSRAAHWGLSERCQFETGDLREVARSARGYDVAVYASVGALGPLDECVGTLRRCVRDGGFLVVEEGFLAPAVGRGTRFVNLAGYEETRSRLTAHGDEILRERVLAPEEMGTIDRRYIESISARAEVLATRHPDKAALLLDYVERQKSAAAAWEHDARSAAWLLQKPGLQNMSR
jgi:cyclopropane fatty-acyl-phospholipid synthase-like methyltransferase